MGPISLIVVLAATSTFVGQVQSKCSANCKSCIRDLFCDECMEGTYKDRDSGEFTFCPGGCTSCNSTKYCFTCHAGFYGPTCTRSCPSRYCVNNACGCIKCNVRLNLGEGICLQCNDGFYKVDGKCYSCGRFCKICDENGCQACNDGFYESGGTCLMCNDGLYESGGICHSCDGNCEICDKGGCIECYDGLYQSGGKCNPCDTSCKTCDEGGCLECYVGSFQSKGKCNPCGASCNKCDKSGCLECNQGFYQRNGTCLECNDEFNRMNDKCELCYTSCNECDLNGCLDCNDGFFQSNGRCYSCGDTCRKCVDPGISCIECKKGFYGPSCEFDCSFCKNSLCTKDECTIGCREDYYQSTHGRMCAPCHEHCTSCRTFEECDSCKDGYYGHNCEDRCRDDCTSCDKLNGLCSSVATSTSGTVRSSASTTVEPELDTTVPFKSSSSKRTSRWTTYASTPSIQSVMTTTFKQSTTDISASKDSLPHSPNDRRGVSIPLYIGISSGGLALIIVIVVIVIVYRRRSSRKQPDNDLDGISMTENERYVSADDYNLPRYTNSTGNGQSIPEGHATNDNIYSMPVKTARPPAVTMETNTAPTSSGSQQTAPLPIPTKSEEYLDHD